MWDNQKGAVNEHTLGSTLRGTSTVRGLSSPVCLTQHVLWVMSIRVVLPKGPMGKMHHEDVPNVHLNRTYLVIHGLEHELVHCTSPVIWTRYPLVA